MQVFFEVIGFLVAFFVVVSVCLVCISNDKAKTAAALIALGIWAGSFLGSMTLLVTVVWVILHFIHKFW